VVGKTNLHEFAYGVTSVNPHFGAVLTPHDPTRVSGGSSGGSAVAVAAGMCDWAIGSDTGGSIRIPAALCGIVGFKPELGTIDTTGVIPLSRSLDTLGPMGPDVATVAEAYAMMSGESVPVDAAHQPRVAVPAGWVHDLDEQTGRAWALVSKDVPEIEFLDHGTLFRNALTILMVEAAVYHRRWATEQPDKYGPDVLAHIKRGLEILAVDYEEARASWPELRASALRAMADVDALILPATAIVAPLITSGGEVREPLARYTRPFNLTGQPVVALPAPSKGLPVGIQVVGRTNEGALAAAAWLEQEWRALGA
jgi:aspartyl-tRNA(Asn)/glutamyl-tRNA(Gln) amidotransferase subunit A